MSEYQRLKAQMEAIKAKQGLRWIVIADEDVPPEDGEYLATIQSVGINPAEATHELVWSQGQWYTTGDLLPIGPVIAWRYKPLPFQPVRKNDD